MNKKLILPAVFLGISYFCYSQKEAAFQKLNTSQEKIYDICFTNKGNLLGVADGNSVKFYSSHSGEQFAEFKDGHQKQILTIDISKDSSLLASGGKDSIIVIWDLITKTILKTLPYHKGIITSLKISPDGKYLLSGGSDKKAFLYDLKKNVLIREFADQGSDITTVAFSPDCRLFATGGGDKLIYVYSIDQNEPVATLPGHKNWVRDISFSQDGTKLISCGDDSEIISWDIKECKGFLSPDIKKNQKGWILTIDLNHDNNTYVFGGLHGKIFIRGPVANYKGRVKSPVCRVKFQPNTGIYLKIAIATAGEGAFLINAQNMKN